VKVKGLVQGQPSIARQTEGDGAPPEASPRRPATTVEDLRNGWRLIANALLGEALIQVVLIQPGNGVALMQIHAHRTPEALDLLRGRMAESGFAAAHPGTLPIIHRRLRPQDVPNLDFILADAFIWQDPITLAERGVIGLPPDRALALVWYRRVAALGAAVATRIASLEAEP
jgi:hypothetical protein